MYCWKCIFYLEVTIFSLFNSRFFRCPKEEEELHGMLPVDSRQLENVKGELLKLTKKETMAQRSLDRRAEETEEQNNSLIFSNGTTWPEEKSPNIRYKLFMQLELFFTPYLFRRECWVCVSFSHFFSPPGNDALFHIARATPGHVCM
ncbi:hypothetical protein AVEN_169876-1 [Araneus ventricosus]|uniref:Uncharacterized protein n=1 Tax=Araneus ventricosus TaxID=182803 RepID=A0A4Y2LBA8_ARAVE|nr:hypothetical protein AVEN_169876-1 [Araneus ventricosus]